MTIDAPASLGTRYIFRVHLTTPPPLQVGTTPGANRRILVITGGTFEGECLRGTVAPGGSDWMTVRSDGSVAFNVRMLLETDDGALISLRHRGVRHGPLDILARVDRGEDVDPSLYYMRTTMLFETSAEKCTGRLSRCSTCPVLDMCRQVGVERHR